MNSLTYIRLIRAAEKFQIEDNFKFLKFEDLGEVDVRPLHPGPEAIDIMAVLSLNYKGEIPDRQRELNMIIGDWVEKHERQLTRVIHKELAIHLKRHYPKSISDINGDEEDTAIELDQSEYYPRVSEKKNTIRVNIELVLRTESVPD